MGFRIFRSINNIHIPLFFLWSGRHIKPRMPRQVFICDCDLQFFSIIPLLSRGLETVLYPFCELIIQRSYIGPESKSN